MSKSGITLLIAIVIAVGGSFWFLWRGILLPEQTSQAISTSERALDTAVYQCASGATIEVVYIGDTVGLSLSDGRSLTLNKSSVSDEGVSYTNGDGSVVLWTKEFSAFLEEGGTTTFAGCVSKNLEDLPR